MVPIGLLFMQECPEAKQMGYSVFVMLAMLLYFLLVIDLAVLSTKVSYMLHHWSKKHSNIGGIIFETFTSI